MLVNTCIKIKCIKFIKSLVCSLNSSVFKCILSLSFKKSGNMGLLKLRHDCCILDLTIEPHRSQKKITCFRMSLSDKTSDKSGVPIYILGRNDHTGHTDQIYLYEKEIIYFLLTVSV